MPAFLAALLVFVCSAAVLMLEILAGRLLAPYVGVSLNTYTAIIGTVLAAIALGAWGGGKLADRVDPRRLLGPVIVLGGACALATVPMIGEFGPTRPETGGVVSTVFLAMTGFFLPAAVLSAVHPMVTKLRLRDLHETGGVVGSLSGIGTFGALVGTFVTGFLLVATVPTRTLIFCIGGFLVALGLVVWWSLSRATVSVMIVLVVLAGFAAAAAAGTEQPCDRESPYFCIRVERDFPGGTGRTLWLDNGRHSYVDLADPTYIQFEYIQSFIDVLDVAYPGNESLAVVHVGGGGFTMPRYVDVTRPGSRNTVFELDQTVFDTAREELGLRTSRDLRVRIGDGRLLIRDRARNSADVVVGDAFNSLSVPWHLTTREFVADVDRVLRADGVYVMNIIDEPPFRFAPAELATLQERFEHVALIANGGELSGFYGGNLVLVASHRELDDAAIADLTLKHGDQVARGIQLRNFVDGAAPLTDDFAPVDQWLAENDN